MEIDVSWFAICWIAGVIAVPVLMGIGLWYASPGTRRDKAGLSLCFKQFTLPVQLTPEEVQGRLNEVVQPFKLLRMSYEKEAYEGQWVTADRFELRRLAPRNYWYVYLDIFPYLQNTTLVQVTLRTPTIALFPPALFCLGPILVGILVNEPFILITSCNPIFYFGLIGVGLYIYSLLTEANKARAFLERIFVPL